MVKKKQPQTQVAPTSIPINTTTGTEVPTLKKFALQRVEDETGISGTGYVAVGVMFPSGQCFMEWNTPVRSRGHYMSIADVEAIHGHGGKTRVIWVGEF